MIRRRFRDRSSIVRKGSLAMGFATALAAACSSQDASGPANDAGDARDASAGDTGDAGVVDAAAPSDASSDVVVDASPPSVACTSQPCAVEIAAGFDSVCVRLEGGSVRCWGSNGGGELGRGEDAGPSANTPAPVVGLTDATQISGSGSAPGDVYCARRASGEGVCWGSNSNGVLGRVSKGKVDTRSSPTPEPVTGLGPITGIFAGHFASCATLAGNEIACWGSNAAAQIPNQPQGTPPLPPTTFSLGAASERLGVAERGTVALTPTGLFSWGLSGERRGPQTGVLGREASTETSPPAKIELAHVSAMAASGGNACAIANGQVFCWGYGALPEHDSVYPVAVGVGSAAVYAQTIAVGPRTACATLSDGAAFCWGDNSRGQLGGGDFDPRRRPVRVEKLGGIPVRMAVMEGTVCAILDTGKVQCWGQNDKGQLGTGAADALPHLEPQNVVLTP